MKKGVKIGIGLLVVSGLLIFAFMYLKGNTILNNEKKVKALFPNIEGLIEASPLLLNGFKVGEVSAIELRSDSGAYKVLVTFLLKTDVRIPHNSQVRIISSDLLGTKAVELVLSQEKEPIREGEFLTGLTEESFKDKITKEIAPLKAKADNLFSSFDSTRAIIKDIKNSNVGQNLKASFASIKKSIAIVKQTHVISGSDSSAIKSIQQKVASINANLTKNQPLINKLINNVNNITDKETQNTIKRVITQLNTALADAKNIVAYMGSGKGTAGKFMKTTAIQDNLNKASNDMNLLLKEVMMNPDRYIHVSVFGAKKKPATADSL